jgi:hypothetical protein
MNPHSSFFTKTCEAKSSRVHTPSIVLHAFPADETLCVFSHLRTYINQTKPLRGNETKLFISYMKPHHRISRDTIFWWTRQTMTNSGVDAQILNRTVSDLLLLQRLKKPRFLFRTSSIRQAGWSSSPTYDKFYHKHIVSNEQTFATAGLSSKWVK